MHSPVYNIVRICTGLVAGQTFEELDVDKSKTLDIYEFSGTAAHRPGV